MIDKTYAEKHYSSASKRFLHATIAGVFEKHFPGLFGSAIRNLMAGAILAVVDEQTRVTETLRPGQCLWNAVAIETRPDSPKLQLKPVVLTLVDELDIERLATGESPNRVAQDTTARILLEAYEQGGLLSTRDVGLLTWRDGNPVTKWRQAWESRNETILPHPGSLQDFGSCVTHKKVIVVKAIYENKDTRRVAKETHHTQQAVDRYLKDFHRVRTCYQHNQDTDFICQVTGMSKHLVSQYLRIIDEYEPKPLTGSTA